MQAWEQYEQTAKYLLNEFTAHFDSGTVEDEQLVPGESGTHWKIVSKAVKDAYWRICS